MADLKYPVEFKYQDSDEWVLVDGDLATIGISDFAQDQLNDIVYVEMPSVGDTLSAGEPFGVVESVKAAADLMMPVSGEVTAVNESLEEEPEVINSDPYGKGWIIKVKMTDKTGLDNLMDAETYKNSRKSES
ncbi:MAG TPA: glycine cleavage system protein GcvH [Aggregatilineales bacterium]|nr:glycine cleavage system protein GcvH [Aggregatilineales bacterium]